jgi:ParB/RepB/Spo0J family partition protein
MINDNIPLGLLRVNPENPRKTFDAADLQELATSIEQIGLLQPILVRPIEYFDRLEGSDVVSSPTMYQIVNGERRYRAMKLLEAKKPEKWNRIAAIVREMSDDEAYIAMISENLQRKDVDPIEEAFSFAKLYEKGMSVEEMADQFGKSTKFVYDRIKLKTLIPELMLAVREKNMSLSAAMLIAKLNEPQQKEYFQRYEYSKDFTKQSAISFCTYSFGSISDAPWMGGSEMDSSYAGSCNRACADCSFNTRNQGCLFWELNEGSERCTDKERYVAKSVQYIKDMIAKHSDELLKADEPLTPGKAVLVFVDHYGSDGNPVFPAIREFVNAGGYKCLANPYEVFSKQLYRLESNAVSDGVVEGLEDGSVCKAYNLNNFGRVQFQPEYYEVKGNLLTSDKKMEEDNVPFEVNGLLRQLKSAKESDYAYTYQGCAALEKTSTLDNSPLADVEKKFLMVLMLYYLRDFLVKQNGINYRDDDAKLLRHVEEHPEELNRIIREWMKREIKYSQTEQRALIHNLVKPLGELWCPAEFAKSQDKAKKHIDKEVAKIVKKLAGLGFTQDGQRIALERKEMAKSGVSDESDAPAVTE